MLPVDNGILSLYNTTILKFLGINTSFFVQIAPYQKNLVLQVKMVCPFGLLLLYDLFRRNLGWPSGKINQKFAPDDTFKIQNFKLIRSFSFT